MQTYNFINPNPIPVFKSKIEIEQKKLSLAKVNKC